MTSSRLLSAFAALALGVPTLAQPAPSFPADSLWVLNGAVSGMALGGDTLYVSGRFLTTGPPTGQLAVLDKQTGQPDLTGPIFDGLTVSGLGMGEILLDGAGGYFAGGDFTICRGAECRSDDRLMNLAHVRADGTLDGAFRPSPRFVGGSGARVTSLALDRTAPSPSGAGVLYVGGDFDRIGGVTRRDLAALDAATGAVLPLQATLAYPSTTSYPPRVESLLTHEGVLYVGGIFEEVSGQPRRGLAALDAATGSVLPWRADLTAEVPQFFASPDALALGDGTLYLTGFFDFVNGLPREGPAEVTLADPVTGQGGAVTPWAPLSGGLDNIVGHDLLVVGGFVYVASGGLVKIDRATAVVQRPGLGIDADALAYDPTSGSQGTIYVGGERGFGSENRIAVVAYNVAASGPTSFEVLGIGNTLDALAVEPGLSGRLLVGGRFSTISSSLVERAGLAALDLATGRPTNFAASQSGGPAEDLALSPDGRFAYAYSNIVGGAALRLTEYDIETGVQREFIPSGVTAATYSAHTAAALATRPALSEDVQGTNFRDVGARSANAQGGEARVENATSALVVTDTGGPGGAGRVCLSINGVACYDRATGTRIFYTPMVYVADISEDNGDLLYLPPGGPLGNPGGADGALILAANVEQAPSGRVRPAFAAVDVATGAVIEDWEIGFSNGSGARGYAVTALDPDGPGGPAPGRLYLGGDFESFGGPVGNRTGLLVHAGTIERLVRVSRSPHSPPPCLDLLRRPSTSQTTSSTF